MLIVLFITIHEHITIWNNCTKLNIKN